MCGHENKAYLEFSFSLLMDRLIVRTQNVFFGVRGVHRRTLGEDDGARSATVALHLVVGSSL